MSWSGLAVNQAVSWADLLDAVNTGVLGTGGTTITSSNQCIYKSLATITNYVNINTSYSPYSSRSSNDLLLKGDFQSAASYPNSILIYENAASTGTNNYGWSSAGSACSNFYDSSMLMYYSGSFGNGTVLYKTTGGGSVSSLNIDFTTNKYYVYTSGSSAYSLILSSSGGGTTATVGSIAACSGGGYYTYYLSTSVVNGTGACSNTGGTITYYSASPTLANGVYLFSNTALSSYATGPIYVSDGNNSWYLAGGAIPLASQAACLV